MSERQGFLATHTQNLSASAIRELLKASAIPGMRSFAAGSPAPESFPLAFVKEHLPKILEREGPKSLQYGITEGYQGLRDVLKIECARRGVIVQNEAGPCISPGAQSAIDACARALLNPGDCVLVEAPTFLASLKTFRSYGAQLEQVEMDEEGMLPEALERRVKNKPVKLLYIIPNFHNPTGRTTSEARRKVIIELAKKYNFFILEDDPYYDLRFKGKTLPPLASQLPEQVLYVGSLSKTFSPGMRLGFYEGPDWLCSVMTSLRQGADVHANLLAQMLAAEFLSSDAYAQHVVRIQDLYREKCKALQDALSKHFAGLGKATKPEGGMFLWFDFTCDIDVQELQKKALEQKIAFVPGFHFFADPCKGKPSMRLNFSFPPIESIDEAISELGQITREMVLKR